MPHKPLTDLSIRGLRPGQPPDKPFTGKSYKVFDAPGLYLEVSPGSGRYWRFKYRYGGKEKRLALGTYPEVTLKDARDYRDDARPALPSEGRCLT